jgi:hypothetical protein
MGKPASQIDERVRALQSVARDDNAISEAAITSQGTSDEQRVAESSDRFIPDPYAEQSRRPRARGCSER